MIREIAQEGIELVAREPGIVQLDVVLLDDLREQPQAVGPGKTVQFMPPRSGQAGVAGPAGDEHRALAQPGGEIAEEVGEAGAFLVGVRAADGGGAVIELRQGALIVVPDEEHVPLLHELDGPLPLLSGGELVELFPRHVTAEHLHDALGAGELLEADEARAIAEQPAARPPIRRLGGERGLAHAAHGMKHDAALGAELPLQRQQFPRASVEAVGGRRRADAGQGGATGFQAS